MAEMTRDEFARSIGADPTVVPAPATNAADALSAALPPATAKALNEQSQKLSQSRIDIVAPSTSADADFATRLGARPGVPFDVNTGIPFMSRLRAAAQPTPAEEQKALEAAYGKGSVRRNSFGWLVVTKPDEKGKPTDVLVDPLGLDVGDVADVLGKLPEVGGAILATIATRGANVAPGILNAAKTLLAMTAGSAAAGAAKDVLVRAGEGQPLQPGEIATRRGEQAAIDLAAGTALGVGTKTASLFISPFNTPGPIQFDARKAQEYFSDKYGIRLSMTPAEATGNSFLQRVEALESQKPGASVPFEQMAKERAAQLSELQKLALGGPVPEEEAAGQRAMAALGAKVAPLEQDVQRAAAATGKAAELELQAGTGPSMTGPSIDKASLGQSIQQAALDARSVFQAQNEANYAQVFDNPLAKAPVIEGRALKTDVDSLLKDLPKVQKQVQQATGVLGPGGQPIMQTATVNVPVDTPVRPRLEELSAKLAGGKVSLNDLKQIRTDVDNAIKTGEAIPGVKEGRLKTLYSRLTGAIEQGLSDINDPALTDAWKNATSFYRANVGRFERAGIGELFRDPTNALGPHGVVDRALSSPDTYNAYKEFFGATSPQMQGLSQAVRDSVMAKSPLSPVVDAAGFVRRLEALPDQALADAFGPNAAALRASARTLQIAQGDTLPEKELLSAINSGNTSAESLRQLISSQNVRDAAYRNEIVRAVAKGNLDADKIHPTEFVNRLVFKPTTQPSDVEGVMARLHDRPDVVEDIRRLTFQHALDSATAVAPTTGKRFIVANDLEKLLADQNAAKRLETALGTGTFEDLVQLKNFLKPGAAVQQAARTAGGLSAGMQIAGMVERGPLKYVTSAVRNFFVSTAYTSPPIRALLTNTAMGPQGKANLVNYIIASTPFLEAVSKTFSKEEARNVIANLKDGVDQDARTNPQATEQPLSRDEFLKMLGK